jgi:hypothetical protein
MYIICIHSVHLLIDRECCNADARIFRVGLSEETGSESEMDTVANPISSILSESRAIALSIDGEWISFRQTQVDSESQHRGSNILPI